MIKTKRLKTLQDFESIKKGDNLVCEFHRDIYFYSGRKTIRSRFHAFVVVEVKASHTEIILEKKNNIYFNYTLFLDPSQGASNLKDVVSITQK